MVGVCGVALSGLLHAAAAGALVLAGLSLAASGVVEVGSPAEAAGHSVAFGLASLRVPLEAGDVQGTFAPLTGLGLTLWGLVSGARRLASRWPGGRAALVGAIAVGFSAACTAAAVAAGAAASLEPSLAAGAVAGLLMGAAGAALGTRRSRLGPGEGPDGPRTLGPASGKGPGSGEGAGRLRTAWRVAFRVGPPSVTPGLAGAIVTTGIAAAWYVVAVVVRLSGLPFRAIAGGILLALAAAPNAVIALAALGMGAPVDAVLSGPGLADPIAGRLSLWDWGAGLAPLYTLVLVIAPLLGATAAGRASAALSPDDPALLRGLRNGAVLGAVVAVGGWAGSFAAEAGVAEAAAEVDRLSARLGFSPLLAFGLALAWGVAGAYAASLRRSRVGPP